MWLMLILATVPTWKISVFNLGLVFWSVSRRDFRQFFLRTRIVHRSDVIYGTRLSNHPVFKKHIPTVRRYYLAEKQTKGRRKRSLIMGFVKLPNVLVHVYRIYDSVDTRVYSLRGGGKISSASLKKWCFASWLTFQTETFTMQTIILHTISYRTCSLV